MSTNITWRRDLLVSGLHAAEALVRQGTLADSRLSEGLSDSARQLDLEIRVANLPGERFWRNLIPLSGRIESRRQLVETAVTKTMGRGQRFEQIVTNITAQIAAVEAALRIALPNLAEELALRERPLREHWEARGPGLLKQIGISTDESLVVQSSDVLLVHPALGGGGQAHLAYNSVRIEAVLANPVAELPEVVRLAWLIGQLQLDLPVHSEAIHADRLPHIAGYAMLPAALSAAQTVELAGFTPQTVERAIAAWHLAVPKDVNVATLVRDWWQTYQETRPPWNVALAALDQMFG